MDKNGNVFVACITNRGGQFLTWHSVSEKGSLLVRSIPGLNGLHWTARSPCCRGVSSLGIPIYDQCEKLTLELSTLICAGEAGVACLAIGQMKLVTCQIIDTTVGFRHVRSQITRFEPTTVILLETSHADVECFNRSVEEACASSECALVHVNRRCFDDTRGFELISEYSSVGCIDCDLSSSNYLAVGASGAALDSFVVWTTAWSCMAKACFMRTPHSRCYFKLDTRIRHRHWISTGPSQFNCDF